MFRAFMSPGWGLGLLITFCLLPGVAAQELPKGEALMDRYVQATGGKKAFEKIKSQILQITISVKGKKGKILVYRKAPGLLYQEIRIPGSEPIRMGYNEKVAWELHPLTGAKILRGTKAEELKRIADLQSEVQWRKHFKKAETIKEENRAGKAVYQVKLTTPMGAVQIRYFDKKTGLLLEKIDKVKVDIKEFDFVTKILAYKKADGILIDSHARQSLAGQKTELRLDSVEMNVDIPASRFAVPAAVKKKLKDA